MANNRTPQEEELLIKFGKNLRRLRVEQGLTQEDVAFQAGFSRSYYTEIETGKRNTSLLNLKKIADCLDLSLKQLLDFEEG